MENDEKVRAKMPERAEQQNCLLLLEEAEANEEEQSADIHGVTNDSVGTNGNKLLGSVERSRRSALERDRGRRSHRVFELPVARPLHIALSQCPRQRFALQFLRIIEEYLCGFDPADF